MKFIVDTREQKGYEPILARLKHNYINKCLKIGDYSLEGHENAFAIERKSLNDFISSITSGRERFKRELERAQKLRYFAIVLECDFYDIKNKNYYSNINRNSILSTIFHWSVKYKIPIFLVGTAEGGALATIRLAEAYLKYVQ